jgi:hypothetical protein
MSASETELPAGIGDQLGPEYIGNTKYGERDRIPTNYGVIRIDRESLVRFTNGARQEVVSGHHEARCPCCYDTITVDGTGDDARADCWEMVLGCCDEVRWLPPSDYLDPCPVCGHAHRDRHDCRPPISREPHPDFDQPAECTDCEWRGEPAKEELAPPDARCPECESVAVLIGGEHIA